jgi:hypothetical protein
MSTYVACFAVHHGQHSPHTHRKQLSHHPRQHRPPVAFRVPSVSGDRPALAVTTSFAVKNWHRPATITCNDLVAAPEVLSVASAAQTYTSRYTHCHIASRNKQSALSRRRDTYNPPKAIHIASRAADSRTQDTLRAQPSRCSWKPQVIAGIARGGYHAGTLLCDTPLESPRTCLGLEVRCIIASLLPVLSRSLYPNPLPAQCLVS